MSGEATDAADLGKLTHDFGGPHGSGRYHLHTHNLGVITVDGAEAGVLALLLIGWKLRAGVRAPDVLEAP